MSKWEFTKNEVIVYIDNKGNKYIDSLDIIVDKLNNYEKQLAELKVANKRLQERVLSEKEWQHYCAYKIIEPEIKGCLDRERQYKQQLKEKDEEIEKFKGFAKFVTNALFDDWNEFSGYDELFCRQLLKLGLIKYSKDKKYYQPAIKLDGDMVVQYCKKIKVELEEKLQANTHQVCEKIRRKMLATDRGLTLESLDKIENGED